VLKNIQTGDLSEMPVAGVFVFIGLTPNTALVKGMENGMREALIAIGGVEK